jgi:hypothetical protein
MPPPDSSSVTGTRVLAFYFCPPLLPAFVSLAAWLHFCKPSREINMFSGVMSVDALHSRPDRF